jgi:hypothetical protein
MTGPTSNEKQVADARTLPSQSKSTQEPTLAKRMIPVCHPEQYNSQTSSPVMGHHKNLSSKGDLDVRRETNHSWSDSTNEEADVLLFDTLPERRELLGKDHQFNLVVPALVDIGLRTWMDRKVTSVSLLQGANPIKYWPFLPSHLFPHLP